MIGIGILRVGIEVYITSYVVIIDGITDYLDNRAVYYEPHTLKITVIQVAHH